MLITTKLFKIAGEERVCITICELFLKNKKIISLQWCFWNKCKEKEGDDD